MTTEKDLFLLVSESFSISVFLTECYRFRLGKKTYLYLSFCRGLCSQFFVRTQRSGSVRPVLHV